MRCDNNGVDIVFIMDGSSSISEEGFESQKSFIQDLMANILSENSTSGVIQFSTGFAIEYDFNWFFGAEVNILVSTYIEQLGGSTWTARAMEMYLQTMVSAQNNRASLGKKQAVVLITDGNPSRGQSPCDPNKYVAQDFQEETRGNAINKNIKAY